MKKNYKLLTLSPFAFSTPSGRVTARTEILLFLPHLVLLFLTHSYRSLVLIGLSVAASITASIINSLLRNKSLIPQVSAVFQGLLIGLFLPQNYPYVSAFLIILIVLLLAKYTFGGFAQSWANPTALTIIMIYFFGTKYFPVFQLSLDMLQAPNALNVLVRNGTIPLCKFDTQITGFINEFILSPIGATLPEGYVSLLWDAGGVIPAFRFNLFTLVATLVLFSFNMLDVIIPAIFFSVYALCVRWFALLPYGGILWKGDILLAMCTSGTLITGFFLLPWAGTTPLSIPGKMIYALAAGIFAFVLNGAGTSPIGSMFTILIVNVMSPAIQLVEEMIYHQMMNRKLEATK